MTDLQAFLDLANKEFGDNSAIILDDTPVIKADVIPTGIEVVDNAIGVGGIPRGRITEIFGGEGCGKTTMCLHAIAQAQEMGLNTAFVDAEHAVTIDRMHAVGVDTSRMVFSQPDSGEAALNLVELMVNSGNFGIIVIDSVAALTPQVEYEKDMGDSVMGVHARLMSQAMRKLTAPASKKNTALMFTNQTRAKIGGYVVGETTTGGAALKFYASLRMRMQFIGQIKNTAGIRVSGKYKMTVVKNKMAVPFKEALFEINQHGIDGEGYFIDKLIEAGILEKAGSFIKFEGDVLAQGRGALRDKFLADPDLKKKLTDLLP